MGKVRVAKRFALGTVMAAGVGYLAGILTAPKTGKEMRENIKDAATHSVATGEKRLKKLHTELARSIDEAQDIGSGLAGKAQKDIESAIAASKTVRQKAREILSATHEGHADDKELQKAITDAEKALKHLKSFLKK